jgi:hypothetical protein
VSACGIERRKQRLKRSTRCQDVIDQEHACARWNLKASTEFTTRGTVRATHLFSEEAADAEKSTNLVRQENSASRWSNDEINVTAEPLNQI